MGLLLLYSFDGMGGLVFFLGGGVSVQGGWKGTVFCSACLLVQA